MEFIMFLRRRGKEFFLTYRQRWGLSWEFIGIQDEICSRKSPCRLQGKCPLTALGLTSYGVVDSPQGLSSWSKLCYSERWVEMISFQRTDKTVGWGGSQTGFLSLGLTVSKHASCAMFAVTATLSRSFYPLGSSGTGLLRPPSALLTGLL